MKYIILFISLSAFSQEVSRNTISIVGNSSMTISGYYVTQSVGQLSMIGFSDIYQKSIIQGYQQPNGFKTLDTITSKETVLLFPVPVSNSLTVLFSSTKEGTCSFEVFDTLGRLVLSEEASVLNFSASVSLFKLASTNYIVKLTTKNSIFYETIIKN